MDKSPQKSSKSESEVQNPDRRQLLKLLAAGGVVTAVSLIPGKWSSPTIKSGVLPAHAQVTPGRFEVLCSEQSNYDEGEGGWVFYIFATAWDTSDNSPVSGVGLKATLVIDTTTYTETVSTDSQGLASFSIPTIGYSFISAEVTVSYEEQGVYGTDTCSLSFAEIPQ